MAAKTQKPSPQESLKIIMLSDSKGHLTKQRIVEAAVRSLVRGGIETSTFETIAKEAKLSIPLVKYHFSNKNYLLELAIHHVLNTESAYTQSHIAAAKTPQDKLKAWIEGDLRWIDEHPDHRSIDALFDYLCTKSPAWRDIYRSIREQSLAKLVGLVQESLVAQGLSFAQAREHAHAVRNMAIGFVIEYQCLWGTPEAKEVRKLAARKVVEFAFKALS